MSNLSLKTGPRGGKYYISKNGNKIYIKENVNDSNKYCGPSGGYPDGTYPVSTNKSCIGSLSQSWRTPRPCDLALCIHRNCPDIGHNSKTFKNCGIVVSKQKQLGEEKFINFHGYLISEKVKQYLEKKSDQYSGFCF